MDGWIDGCIGVGVGVSVGAVVAVAVACFWKTCTHRVVDDCDSCVTTCVMMTVTGDNMCDSE